jgi:sugar phosphate permease
MAMITYIERVCIFNAAPFIRRNLGLSVNQMGCVFSIFAVACSILEMPFGCLCDRYRDHAFASRGVTGSIALHAMAPTK